MQAVSYRRAIELADHLAEQTLKRTQLWSSPPAPTPIVELARALGAHCEALPLEIDGGLRVEDETRARIVVNSERPLTRQSFSIAHELAHWLLRNPQWRTDLTAQVQAAFSSEERLCDALGASLLMPRPWVNAQITGRPRDMNTLRDIANRAGVSLSATLLRLAHVAGWREVLLHWSKIGSEWVLDDIAGLPARQEGLITSTAATRLGLASLACSAGKLLLGQKLPLLIGADEREFAMDVMVHSEGATALLRLPASVPRSWPPQRKATLRRRGEMALMPRLWPPYSLPVTIASENPS
jgi:hypothetical protein